MKRKAYIYIIVAGVLWGTSGIFVNMLAPYGFSSVQLTAARGAVSALFMAVYLLIRDKKAFRIKPLELLLVIGSGAALFGTASCYYMSLQATSIATAVVLMYMAPALVMIFSVLFLGERFNTVKGVALVMILVGGALVSGIVGGLKFNAFGFAMGIMSAISYGSYNILTKVQMRCGVNPLSATFYTFLFMSVIALCVSDPAGIVSAAAQRPAVTLPWLIALGIGTGVIPYFAYTLALRTLDAGTASSLAIIEPMSATLFGVVIYNEKLTVFSVVGIILIVSAVFMLGREKEYIKNKGDKLQ